MNIEQKIIEEKIIEEKIIEQKIKTTKKRTPKTATSILPKKPKLIKKKKNELPTIVDKSPTAASPTSAKPTSTKPTSAKPTSTKPTSAKPTSAKPTTTKPIVKKILKPKVVLEASPIKKSVVMMDVPATLEPPIKENKTIGIDNINVILESLENISIQDILTSNENPDITTMINNMLAIS